MCLFAWENLKLGYFKIFPSDGDGLDIYAFKIPLLLNITEDKAISDTDLSA